MNRIVIIGGGLSGLSTAFYIKEQAKLQNKSIEITILEKEPRIGGKIWSIQENGYLCEYGPNGFLDSKPDTLDLCNKLGLAELLLKSNDNARKRFVVDNNLLFKLPHSPLEFIKCKLISIRGKLRIFFEIFVKPNVTGNDESVANFARRRLGDEALDKLIAPMSSGIYAGNPETMSLAACFPRIKQLETEYGGLFKAMFKLMKAKKSSGASPSGPGGILTSFKDGAEILTNRLANKIGYQNIKLGTEITNISRQANKYKIEYKQDGAMLELECDKLIMATPAYASANLLFGINQRLSSLLSQIKYSALAVVCLGYDLNKINHDTNGFGYLYTQNNLSKDVLGTLWDSSIFINRAPTGKILFRSILGGARNNQINNYSDSELISITQQSLRNILGIDVPAEFVKVIRHNKAIPQYNVGHLELLSKIDQEIITIPNLYLVGNAYYGIGINDCVSNAKKIAEQLINHIS